MIDTNVYVSRWPFRRLPGDETAVLVQKLRAAGVVEAWAGSFDAVLHRDMGAVNLRVTEECRKNGNGLLKPVGCVNPMLPDWREDLRRCQERYGMKAIRLHPNYHGYRLEDAVTRELLSAAAERGLFVQIAAQMEDERTQHSLLRVAPVPLQMLPELTKTIQRLRVQVLNHPRPVSWERVYWDFCAVEGVRGLTELLKGSVADSLCFGSYYPFFLWESAALKMKEAGAEGAVLEKLRAGTARVLMGGTGR
ncbi:MAG: amidohydrolase family protein [Acidobacteria bacterium]|nr:amidohydrolase family protein [Acidobacteriota bacterium]